MSRFTRAILKRPGATYASGLTVTGGGVPDLARALVQHSAYERALEGCGLVLTVLPADDRYPDGTFVEDAALVTEQAAIITLPCAPSRLGETATIERAVDGFYPTVLKLNAPSTLDGGDVCQCEDRFLIGVSAHPVWIGLIFAYLFGYKLGWTPITGYCNAVNPVGSCGGPAQWAYHLILPWITFAILFAALYARMIRANVMETMNEDYVRTARAKGAPEWQVMRSHVLRNAMLPVVTMLGMDISLALGGAVFTETVYGLPGLGHTLLQSLDSFDMPTTLGIVVFATMSIIVINLIVDLLYAVIDPRIRLG